MGFIIDRHLPMIGSLCFLIIMDEYIYMYIYISFFFIKEWLHRRKANTILSQAKPRAKDSLVVIIYYAGFARLIHMVKVEHTVVANV